MSELNFFLSLNELIFNLVLIFDFRVLKLDPYHSKCLTIQIGCLVELKEFNSRLKTIISNKVIDFYILL